MEDYITIFIKFVKTENAYRIWGENTKTNKYFWLPALSSDKSEIPDGVKTVINNLL